MGIAFRPICSKTASSDISPWSIARGRQTWETDSEAMLYAFVIVIAWAPSPQPVGPDSIGGLCPLPPSSLPPSLPTAPRPPILYWQLGRGSSSEWGRLRKTEVKLSQCQIPRPASCEFQMRRPPRPLPTFGCSYPVACCGRQYHGVRAWALHPAPCPPVTVQLGVTVSLSPGSEEFLIIGSRSRRLPLLRRRRGGPDLQG